MAEPLIQFVHIQGRPKPNLAERAETVASPKPSLVKGETPQEVPRLPSQPIAAVMPAARAQAAKPKHHVNNKFDTRSLTQPSP
jgi:hypothetical protein